MHGVHLSHDKVHDTLLHRRVPVLPVVERIAVRVACVDAYAFDPEAALRKRRKISDKTVSANDSDDVHR